MAGVLKSLIIILFICPTLAFLQTANPAPFPAIRLVKGSEFERFNKYPAFDNDKPVIPLSEGGQRLQQFYLSLDVEHLWIAGQHINWETGVADNPDATSGIHTHCSAFVAAACKRLNIYILRPPEHKQILLANAQYDWLTTKEAADAGWKPIMGNNIYEAAQSLANRGTVVMAICKNEDEKKPGHAALIMPDQIALEKIAESGPVLIMASTHNFNKISLRNGFKSHVTMWPEHVISFYYNAKVPVFAMP